MNSPTGNEVQRFKPLTNNNGASVRLRRGLARSLLQFIVSQIVFWLQLRLNKLETNKSHDFSCRSQMMSARNWLNTLIGAKSNATLCNKQINKQACEQASKQNMRTDDGARSRVRCPFTRQAPRDPEHGSMPIRSPSLHNDANIHTQCSAIPQSAASH